MFPLQKVTTGLLIKGPWMLISSILPCLLYSRLCSCVFPHGHCSDLCLCTLCVHEQFVMWHVYVSSVCVCAHKPLLSPRHPPGEWGEVGRLKIAPGSLNTGSQNTTAHESHRLSVSPSPSFPFPHALFRLWETRICLWICKPMAYVNIMEIWYKCAEMHLSCSTCSGTSEKSCGL